MAGEMATWGPKHSTAVNVPSPAVELADGEHGDLDLGHLQERRQHKQQQQQEPQEKQPEEQQQCTSALAHGSRTHSCGSIVELVR